MTKFIHDHPDILHVILAHLAAIGLSFTNVEFGLKVISLLSAIGYTCWKWHYEYRKTKRND